MKTGLGLFSAGKLGTAFSRILPLALAGLTLAAAIQLHAAGVAILDTGTKLDPATHQASGPGWTTVPSELFVFETDPAKAASDPGYYGREYSFKGDTAVENRHFTAVFQSNTGRILFFSHPRSADSSSSPAGKKVLEVVCGTGSDAPEKINRIEILRNAGDEAIIEATLMLKNGGSSSAVFTFGRNEIVGVRPGKGIRSVSLNSPIERAVVPGFLADDLIFSARDFAGTDSLHLPSENLLLGLLEGNDHLLVATWPKGDQRVSLRSGSAASGPGKIGSVELVPAGEPFYLSLLASPGIWHREDLKPAHLEKDVPLSWLKPFPAKWKTQLSEAGVRTTFAFREGKGTIWRGVPGSYNYPAWFEGGKAFLHLSKKVPPKGEALIYFLEGEQTPDHVLSPVDVLKATLGRPASESILDAAGQRLRTHHRRAGDGVHRACTCGCTEAIQAIFEAGQEVAKKSHVEEALGDMNYFVKCHLERIEEYQAFARDLISLLQSRKSSTPSLKLYLEQLEQLASQIPEEYKVQKENMKSLGHAADLTKQTLALTGGKNQGNLAAYMELLKAWRAMGGAQDYVVAQCHTLTRKLFQEAGYTCVSQPEALPVAREIRARCRQVLRNPDGYEIWANY